MMPQRSFKPREPRNFEPEAKEFEEKVVRVSRVSKKTSGGNRMGFSVVVVVGDRKGRVGVGLGKAGDVQSSIKKGVSYAKKHLITVPMQDNTIPHEVYVKVGAAKLVMRPASPGTGVIAGGPVRAVVEAAGIRDILTKVLGTSNQASNVYAALEALRTLKPREGYIKDAGAEVKKDVAEPEAQEKVAKKVTKKATEVANVKEAKEESAPVIETPKKTRTKKTEAK